MIKNSEKGSTLIEYIVTTMVFSLIVIIIGQVFVQALHLQRRGFAAQKIQENGLFVLEFIAREIRVSTINEANNINCSPVKTTLNITHPVNGAVIYGLNNGVVTRTAGGVPTNLSSQAVNFLTLKFCVDGVGADLKQPRVTIVADIENRTGTDSTTYNIQTTVSIRDLSDEL